MSSLARTSLPLLRLGIRSHLHSPSSPLILAQQRRFATTEDKNSQQGTNPSWKGRTTEDHAVNRSGHDVQSEASQSGMKAHQDGEHGSGGLSRKDEGGFNKKAKEDHPEAPEPVIGMNSERGTKGHGHSKSEKP